MIKFGEERIKIILIIIEYFIILKTPLDYLEIQLVSKFGVNRVQIAACRCCDEQTKKQRRTDIWHTLRACNDKTKVLLPRLSKWAKYILP